MTRLVWLALGGVAGTFARYFLSGWVMGRGHASAFPYGTLAVNSAGCLLVGLFAALDLQKGLGFSAKLMLITGFCGAFTTFSALVFESFYLLREQGPFPAALNILLNLAAGFVLLGIGLWIGGFSADRLKA